MKKVALITGRYIKHNLYRELGIYDELLKRNYLPFLFLPKVGRYSRGYSNKILEDKIFKERKPILFKNSFDLVKKCIFIKYIICGSDKDYAYGLLFLRLIGKKIISYDSAGGTDQFNNFANITCVKSNFHKDFFINSGGVLPRSHKLQRFIKLRPKKSSVIVTGSILYEENFIEVLNNRLFREKYNLTENEKIIVLFPKAIFGYEKKIDIWCKNQNPSESSFLKKLHKDLNLKILDIIRSFGSTPLVKLHPLAFNGPDSNKEIDFWESNNAKLIDVSANDTFSMYKNLSLGISLNSQSSLDVNLFSKPFIYLDDGKILPPWFKDTQEYKIHNNFPQGASSNWDNDKKNLFKFSPSWVGRLSEIKDLKKDLIHIFNEDYSNHYEKFIKEFWYKNDNKASSRIVDLIEEL